MNKSKLRSAALVLLLGTAVAAQSAWRVLHDPLTVVRQPAPTPAERAWMTRAAMKAGFSGGMTLEARVPGPFLLRGAQETALLYGDGQERLALLVLRGAKPVLHLWLASSEGFSRVREAYALRDMNGDGLRELAVVQEFADAGSGLAWLTYLNFAGVAAGGLPRISPAYRTGKETCEPGGPDDSTLPGEVRKYRLWVRPGPTPQLRADELGAETCDDAPLTVLRQGIPPIVEADVPVRLTAARLPLP